MRSNLEDLMREADPAELYEMPPITGDRNDPLYASILSRRGIDMVKETTDRITRPTTRPEEGTRPARGWLVAAAAFLTVLVVGTMSLFWLTRSGGPEVIDEPPPTTVVTTTTPPTTVAPSPLSLPDTWQRVGAAVMTPVVGIFDMTETPSGLVAVGFDPGEEDFRQNGTIFTSSDGVNWTRLAEDDPASNLGTVLIYGVTDGGPGIVAVGTGCEDDAEQCAPYPTVWTSSDGTSWNRSSPDPDVFGETGALEDVVNTEYGLIAVGGFYTFDEETALIQPTVWLSPDGIQWERVWQGEAYDFTSAPVITHSESGFQSLAANNEGRVVGVGSAVNGRGDFVGAIWTSTDGRDWERIDKDSEMFASTTDSYVAIQDVAAGPGGFVAVGSDGGTEVAIWHSPDGLTWTRANTGGQPFEYIGTLSAVDSLGAGWVIAGPDGFSGSVGGTVTLWTSPDGLTWDRVKSIDPGYASSVVTTESGIAVGGAIFGTDDFHAAVWAGPAFDPAAPPPDPGPATQPAQEEVLRVPDEGLSCDELVDLGYEYLESASYWAFYKRPAELDPDGDGAPCEAEYSVEDVVEVFGPDGKLAIEFGGGGGPGPTFSAAGPAVDAGVVCANGTIEFQASLDQPAGFDTWEDEYICDDGSGSFILATIAFFEDGPVDAVWRLTSGTGRYENLAGGGILSAGYGTETDFIIGGVWFAEDED